ncbi:GspH/FimT family pseudopilin [Halomonas kalidii]|uniref:Type II secretion system protein H n=1 Tax=Halomonas kalidii TaxID=3043293 RepID=A0ABT6VH65_9GAMM|nr:GspH/FimT family pseudopilin [Halomonas kalidii]MDI5932612.1 GspH/FimT family pseudopilin [Halomonas kalidii]
MRPVTARALYLTGKREPLAKHRQRGLTLIELVVAIAVLVILVTWAIPGFQNFTARNEVAAEVLRLKTALAMARNTAITRRTTIAVCPVAAVDATHCELGDWSLPLAIVEGNTSGTGLQDATLLRLLDGTDGPAMTFNRDQPVRYQATGWSRGHNGTFTICGGNGAGAEVIVNNMGRIRTVASKPETC